MKKFKKRKRKKTEHFYFLLLVMNSDTASVAPSSSRPGTPLQDEKMEAQPDSTSAQYSPPTYEEMRCEFVEDTFFSKEGPIVQFINGNCAGSTSLIGGMRLASMDIKMVPAYLSRNKLQLKKYAIRYLDAHFRSMQCCIGATESLTVDDYGMSLAIASLTHTGANLNPGKRREGPLFFCLFSGLVEPTMVTLSDWDLNTKCDAAYVINCYIHLLPPSQRRRMVIQKMDDEKNKPKPDEKSKPKPDVEGRTPSSYGKMRKTKLASALSTQKYVPHQRQYPNTKQLTQEISHLKSEVTQMKLAAVPNPPLPTTPAPRWPPINDCLEMPDE